MKIFNLLLAVLVSLPLLATTGAERQDYEKKFSKTFPITSNGTFEINTRYGEVNVETWARNEIKVDVRVKVQANSKSEADQTFERIAVNFSNGSSRVSVDTEIAALTKRSFFITKSYMSGKDFRVYFKVYMPATVSVEAGLKYCDLYLPDLSGDNNINVAYGEISGGDLSGDNEIRVSYGGARLDGMGKNSYFTTRYSDSNLGSVGTLRYDGRYSDTRIKDVNKLTIEAGYEEIDVERAVEVVLRGNYNDLTVGTCDRVDLNGNYCDFDFEEVIKSAEIEARYGDFEIGLLHAGFESIYARTAYIDVQIKLPSDAGYRLDLETRYGDIDVRGDGNLTERKRSSESSTKKLSGNKAGKGSGTIDIRTSYGDIEIY